MNKLAFSCQTLQRWEEDYFVYDGVELTPEDPLREKVFERISDIAQEGEHLYSGSFSEVWVEGNEVFFSVASESEDDVGRKIPAIFYFVNDEKDGVSSYRFVLEKLRVIEENTGVVFSDDVSHDFEDLERRNLKSDFILERLIDRFFSFIAGIIDSVIPDRRK